MQPEPKKETKIKQRALTKGKDKKPAVNIAIVVIPAVLTFIAGVVASYFSYRAGIDAIRLPLMATQTAEAKLFSVIAANTQTVTGTDASLSIEDLSFIVFAYDGDSAKGYGGTGDLTVIHEGELILYKLDYSLPQTGEGNTGMAFWFPEQVDLTDYEFIEVTISFFDDMANCDFYVEDNTEMGNWVNIGKHFTPGAGMTVQQINSETQKIRIPLDTYYNTINRKVVAEIGCNATTKALQGNHTLIISEIKFLKPH